MTDRLHVAAVVAAVTVIFFILRLVRTRQLRAKYSVLWLSVGLGVVVLAAWPGLLVTISDRLGVYYAPATLFMAAIGFLGLLVLHFSWELSRLEDRTRTLAEEHALLRELVESELGLRRDVPPPGTPTDPAVGPADPPDGR